MPLLGHEVRTLGCLKKEILFVMLNQPIEDVPQWIDDHEDRFLAVSSINSTKEQIYARMDARMYVRRDSHIITTGAVFSSYTSMFWTLVAFDYCEYNQLLQDGGRLRELFLMTDPALARDQTHWISRMCTDLEGGLW